MDHITNIMGGNGQLPPSAYQPTPPAPVPQSSQQSPLLVSDPLPPSSETAQPLAPINPLSSTEEEPTAALDIAAVKSMIFKIKDELDVLLRHLDGHGPHGAAFGQQFVEPLNGNETIIEGVFNGLKMVGADGNEYDVAENYASKSKLVEGDMMKLTITDSGKFIYKQIGPIDRKHIRGVITQDQAGQWYVNAEGRNYKVLNAAISYHKGVSGDEATVIVPQDGHSDWAAVEHVIHMGTQTLAS